MQTIQSGVRSYSFGYDTKNQLTSITDPLQRTIGFAYDDAGRVITQTLPDLRGAKWGSELLSSGSLDANMTEAQG